MTQRLIAATPARRRRRQVRADPLLTQLRGLSLAQIEAWIDDNQLNPLAQRRLLRALTKAVVMLIDEAGD